MKAYDEIVPILTQSEDWALYVDRLGKPSAEICSNPHPVRRLGAIKAALRICRSLRCSNPHPVRRLGAISASEAFAAYFAFQSSPSPKTGRYEDDIAGYAYMYDVPILTQSEDWALSYG